MSLEILSNLIIQRVHSVATVYTPAQTKVKRKNREFWAVVFKYEGETVYDCQGKRIVSDLQRAIVLPKGCDYEWICTKSGRFYNIEFESDVKAKEIFSFPVKNPDKLLKKFKDLEYKCNLKAPTWEMESLRDTYSVLLMLLQVQKEKYMPSDKQKKIAPALEYISQNYAKNVSNDFLAAMTGLSTVYFRKLFTAVTGTSPVAYARDVRIRKAKELLKSDYGTLSDLAQALGYPSLYDFSRDFKKHTGVAPSKY